MPFPAPPPLPQNPFRVPPSSQPPPRPRARSTLPASTQHLGSGLVSASSRLPPKVPSHSQAQSQRPAHLDNPYSPPSSQRATQLFDPYPSTQSAPMVIETLSRPRNSGLRERVGSRPPAPPSALGPRGGYGGQSQRPPSTLSQLSQPHRLAGPSGPVDQYRPSQPKTAADVYQGDRASGIPQSQPKPQKGAEILEKLASLTTWLEDKFTEREEERKEAKEILEERFRSLEEENRDLRERLHELALGQKILPTREELSEEITGQLSPALHEFFGTLDDNLRKSLSPLPENVASLSAKKVRLEMLEMQDTARKEAMKQGEVESPLMTLLNHLITKLGPLDNITATLASLSDLPEALEQVAIFRQSMEALQARFENKQPPRPQIHQIPAVEISSYQAQMTQLQQSIDQIKRKIDGTPTTPSGSLEEGKVLAAIAELKSTVDQLKLAAPSVPAHALEGQHNQVSAILELVSGLKQDMAEIKQNTRPVLHTSDGGAIGGDVQTILQTLLAELRAGRMDVQNAAPLRLPTPDTALRPLHAAQASEQSINPPTRIMNRQGKPTSKARHGPRTMQAISQRPRVTGSRDPLSLFGTATANNQDVPSNMPDGDDVFGAVQTINCATTSRQSGTGAKRKADTGTAPLTATYSSIAEALTYQIADLPTPPRPRQPESTESSSRNNSSSSGSVTRRSKKRKTAGGPDNANNSLEVKKEGLMGAFKPTTRSDATKARGLGIEIIDLASSQSSSAGKGGHGRTNSAGGDKTYGSSRKSKQSHKKGMGKGTVSPKSSSTTPPNVSTPGQAQKASVPTQQPAAGGISAVPDPLDQTLGGGAQSQPQTQTQDIEPTQLNESNPDSIFEFGHGQLPSVPSLPVYESTENVETEAETQLNPSIPANGKTTNDEILTSSEQVERSLMEKKAIGAVASNTSDDLFLARLNLPREEGETAPALETAPTVTPRRAEPAYRRWQILKAENRGVEGSADKPGPSSSLTQKKTNFLSMMLDTDEED